MDGDGTTTRRLRSSKAERLSLSPAIVGERSEAAILAALLASGKRVLMPFGHSHRYDLVIDDGGSFTRVQCKTGRLHRGAIRFNACSNNGRRRGYAGDADVFAVYCPALREVYVVPVDHVGAAEGVLRYAPAANGQTAGIRHASDYVLRFPSGEVTHAASA